VAPRTGPCTNRRRRLARPEIWFRILHVAAGPSGSTGHREQTVEVTLGPDWAFETADLGRLTRRVPGSQVVTAVPERTRRPEPAKVRRPPPIVGTLRKAIRWRQQLDAGEVTNQAAIARREGLSRARVTQVLMLLRLAPDMQETILGLVDSPNPPRFPEKSLRPITTIEDPDQQVAAFEAAIEHRA